SPCGEPPPGPHGRPTDMDDLSCCRGAASVNARRGPSPVAGGLDLEAVVAQPGAHRLAFGPGLLVQDCIRLAEVEVLERATLLVAGFRVRTGLEQGEDLTSRSHRGHEV